jgi:hypothetical protein
MDVVVYGVGEAPPGFCVVRSVEELRRHVGKAFLVVVGDGRLAEELGAAYFSEEEWGISCGGMESTGGERPRREESRVYLPNALLRRALQEEGRSRGGSDV